MKKIFGNLFIAVISSAFTFFLLTKFDPPQYPVQEPVPVRLVSEKKVENLNTKPLNRSSVALPDFRSVSKNVTKAVVNITAYNNSGYRVSTGSGVISSKNGFIITNYHVVEGGSQIKVSLFDKRSFEAKLVGHDATTDLALLKVSGFDLPALSFGNSDEVEVGEWVLAVGNPFNLNSTVTAGIVSAKARNINILDGSYSIESFIQTDAVVNPGNSGGALVNASGELIGINAAIISETGAYAGYSFAIPSNLVQKVSGDIQEFGKVKRAILGVNIMDVNDDIASDLSLPSVIGVYVSDVFSGTSADEAGLRKGDVIVAVNGNSTNSVPELQEQIALFRPGDFVEIDFYRQGHRFKKTDVKLKPIRN